MLGGKAINKRAFGSDRPLAARRGIVDRFYDLLGRAGGVCELDDFVRAFGMNDNLYAGVLPANRFDMFGLEYLMDVAVPFPQNELRVVYLFFC